MPLTRLTLTDFRSYAAATVEPGPGFVVLTGENGAGKTNVLEAVSLFAPGRGLRGSALGDMARKGGAGGLSVSAQLGDIDLGTGTLATAPERRIVRINGATASATALSEWLSIVWLTPAQDRLFTDSAGERRRFLDRLVLALNPGHAAKELAVMINDNAMTYLVEQLGGTNDTQFRDGAARVAGRIWIARHVPRVGRLEPVLIVSRATFDEDEGFLPAVKAAVGQ